MTRNLDDTKIIAYLAYNSTAGNVLGLKALAHEFAGNWAVDDIKDIRRIPLEKLLQYNLVDCLSTFYIKERDYPLMVAEQQEALYKGLMLDSLKLIIQIELTGTQWFHLRQADQEVFQGHHRLALLWCGLQLAGRLHLSPDHQRPQQAQCVLEGV